MSYLEQPWKALEAEVDEAIVAAAEGPARSPDAPLVDLEKQLQKFVHIIDVTERAAANLIRHMVDQRKQNVRSIAKTIGKDPKWVKERLDAAKEVEPAEAAA